MPGMTPTPTLDAQECEVIKDMADLYLDDSTDDDEETPVLMPAEKEKRACAEYLRTRMITYLSTLSASRKAKL